MMKKILFVNLLPINPLLGGIERITNLLTIELIKRDYDVVHLALFHRDTVGEQESSVVLQYYFPNTDIYSKENISFYNNFIAQNQIDVIINQFGGFEPSFLFLEINPVNRSRIKVLSVCHNKPLLDYGVFSKYAIIPFPDEKLTIGKLGAIPIKIGLYPVWWWWRQRKKRKRLSDIYNFVLSNSDIFVAYTSGYVSEIIDIVGKDIDKNKFAVIPNPNPNTYTVHSNSDCVKQKQILYVGRFDPRQKRPDLLLKIWHKLYKRYPEWELILLGSGTEKMEKSLKGYVAKHSRVSFKETVDPLPYYKQASILALTSVFEGFPMVVTEAMANGVVPILFDSFDAAREVISPGETGELVKPFDTNEFARKLSGLMDNEDGRRLMAANAAEYVRRYDIQHIIEKWIQLIEST